MTTFSLNRPAQAAEAEVAANAPRLGAPPSSYARSSFAPCSGVPWSRWWGMLRGALGGLVAGGWVAGGWVAGGWVAGGWVAGGWVAGGWVAAGLVIGCQGPPVDIGDVQEEEVAPPPAAPAQLPAGAVIDLGSELPPSLPIQGFSQPERVGTRLASWSEGEVSRVTFDVQGGAERYLVAFLAEPYHMLGEVPVGVSLNGKALMDTTLASGWRGYQAVVGGDRIVSGRNQLSFRFAKRARPRDFNAESNDVRDLSVRFDQVEVQPITARAELSFGSKNALSLAALGEGWSRDPNDRGTGTWTIDHRALIAFHLVPPAARSSEAAPGPAGAPKYTLTLTARTPRGVAERGVNLVLNGAPLGQLSFHETKGAAAIDVPAERLNAENQLALEFARLESPAQLDPASKDTRPLGLRVFTLQVAPRPPAPADPSQPKDSPPTLPDPLRASTTPARKQVHAEAQK